MKMKIVLWAVFITALICTIVLICMEAYYVAVVLIFGILILGHREIWSLLKNKKLPPVDERVRENVGKSVRNGFIFFAVTLAYLMLLFSINRNIHLDTAHVLGGLLISGGTVYLLSYLFYERSEPNLSERGLRMLKTFLLLAGISLAVFIISVFLHNALSALLDIEEPVFFFIAVFIAPLAFAVGLVGSLVVFIIGLFSRAS